MIALAEKGYPDGLDTEEWELYVLLTAEPYRKRGMARALIRHVEELVCISSKSEEKADRHLHTRWSQTAARSS